MKRPNNFIIMQILIKVCLFTIAIDFAQKN